MGDDDDYLKALEIQRKNFEKQFGNLEDMGFVDKSKVQESELSEESDSASESDGDSDVEDQRSEDESSNEDESESEIESLSEEEVKPKVVRLEGDSPAPAIASKEERKLLRKGRAPTIAELERLRLEKEKITKKQQAQAAKEDSENLENDLKLQRLLSESHILAHNMEHLGAELTLQTIDYEDPVGNARRRILDQRIRAAAATNSRTGGLPAKLEKMPMKLRKGIISARERRVLEHEREAREAGIVLSKVKKGQLRDLELGKGATASSDRLGVGKKQKNRVRDRGLKIHLVGKSTRNGLRLSADEINRINNGRRRGRR
uniref:Pre-rrna processing ribosome biogenesis n=1 Tax=Candidozyma auris TaxID=498019 RepID=A0A0L0P6I2_CANAR